jgi:hypothetical protein
MDVALPGRLREDVRYDDAARCRRRRRRNAEVAVDEHAGDISGMRGLTTTTSVHRQSS